MVILMIRSVLPILFAASTLALPTQSASWGDWLASQEGRRRVLAATLLREEADGQAMMETHGRRMVLRDVPAAPLALVV